MAFKKLFTPTAKPQDGMTQAAREAIVDLLHFGVYVDSHIALAEDAMVEATARTLNWDPNISFDYYEGKSIGEVRRVRNDDGEREEFSADEPDPNLRVVEIGEYQLRDEAEQRLLVELPSE